MQGFLQNTEGDVGNYRAAAVMARARLDSVRTPGQRVSAPIAYAATLVRLGDLERARTFAEAGRRAIATEMANTRGGLEVNRLGFEAGAANSEALVSMFNGRYDDAERSARDALAKAIADRASPASRAASANAQVQADFSDRGVINSNQLLARILIQQGRLVEAEVEARRTLIEALRVFGRYSGMGIGGTMLLAEVLYEQGRSAEVAVLADVAIEALGQLGADKGSVSLAQALALRARTKNSVGDSAGALASFREALAVVADDEALRTRYVEGDVAYPATLLAAGDVAAARAIFDRLVADFRERFGERHYLTAEARGYLAAALVRAGDQARALAEFQTALPILLANSRQATDDSSAGDRDRRLQQILEAYVDLLSRMPPSAATGVDPASEAFRVADAARARGVQRALAASAARANIRDADLANLVRQEQDAQKQIAAQFGLLSNILSSPPDQQDAQATTTLRTNIDKLRDARGALRGEIERRFPDYAKLIDPRPSTVAEVQAQLRPGEALLSVYVGAERSFVWAVPKSGAVAFASVPLGEKQIAAAVADLRKALDPQAATLGDIPAFDVAGSHRLIRSLSSRWQRACRARRVFWWCRTRRWASCRSACW